MHSNAACPLLSSHAKRLVILSKCHVLFCCHMFLHMLFLTPLFNTDSYGYSLSQPWPVLRNQSSFCTVYFRYFCQKLTNENAVCVSSLFFLKWCQKTSKQKLLCPLEMWSYFSLVFVLLFTFFIFRHSWECNYSFLLQLLLKLSIMLLLITILNF